MPQERIGSYRVLDKLGSGGMGVVYRAEHVAMGQRAVVKKLWPQYGQNPQVVARFFQEAKIAASIDDPGIVRIFDFGTLGDGSSYIVMEQLSGETLAARVRRDGRMDLHLALALARQAARIIGAAHAHGVVHRDLKPENLFLVPDPEVPIGIRVKVLDFGIAKLLEDGAELTGTGAALGTPAYMPPEQWRSAGRVDARADVYSLGCIVFEMVCGRKPFPGPGQLEYMEQHRFKQPPDPSAVVPGLPEELDAILRRALAKAPEDRFSTMEELSEALSQVSRTAPGDRTPLLSRPPSVEAIHSNPHLTPAFAETLAPRSVAQALPKKTLRRVSMAMVLLALASAAAVGGARYTSARMEGERNHAVAARALEEGDAAFRAHDYPRAVTAYEAARAAGASTLRYGRAVREAAAQRAHEDLESAIRRADFDTARRILDENVSRAGLHYGDKASAQRAAVDQGYVRAHVDAARAHRGDPEQCEREARLALDVYPENAEARSALAACGKKAAPPKPVPESTLMRKERDRRASQLIQDANAKLTAMDLSGAAEGYRAALDLKPSDEYLGYAYRGLGTSAVYSGDSKAAVKWYKLYRPYADEATRQQLDKLIEKYER